MQTLFLPPIKFLYDTMLRRVVFYAFIIYLTLQSKIRSVYSSFDEVDVNMYTILILCEI